MISRRFLSAGASLALITKLKDAMIKTPTPKQLKSHLDQYIVGQLEAKKVMSVACYNHYLRINDKAKKLQKKLEREVIQEDMKDKKLYGEAKEGLKVVSSALSDHDLELAKSNILIHGPSGTGKTLIASSLAEALNVPMAITDCTQLTQAGYIGEDVELCIERLLVSADYDVFKAERGIVVLDEVDKLAKPAASIGTKDVGGEGVQQSLLKMIEGTTVQVQVKKADKDGKTVKKVYTVDTSNILFVMMGAFVGLKDNATPQDLIRYGMIPEIIGRVPVITALESLKEVDLYHILTEPKNALLKQYEYIFHQFGVKLCFTDLALRKVAELALAEGTGARGLRGIMEKILLDVNFECPDSGIVVVLVDEAAVVDHTKVKYYTKDETAQFVNDAKVEDERLGTLMESHYK